MSTSVPPSSLIDSTPAADEGNRHLLAGAAAAIIGGAVWALIVGVTKYEVGWIAWGIGGLVGFAMSLNTDRRSKGLAALAASLAIFGLLFGKVLIQHYITRPAFERELASDPKAIDFGAAMQLRERRGFPPPLQRRLDALASTDTMPDALWEEMIAAGATHAATLPEEERLRLASAAVTFTSANISYWQQLSWGFSPWDLLWFGLAVSTAWRMLGAPPAVATEPAAGLEGAGRTDGGQPL